MLLKYTAYPSFEENTDILTSLSLIHTHWAVFRLVSAIMVAISSKVAQL